eukprot:scaffold133734_cov25-Tisochrysis_lutea.AAC.1
MVREWTLLALARIGERAAVVRESMCTSWASDKRSRTLLAMRGSSRTAEASTAARSNAGPTGAPKRP